MATLTVIYGRKCKHESKFSILGNPQSLLIPKKNWHIRQKVSGNEVKSDEERNVPGFFGSLEAQSIVLSLSRTESRLDFVKILICDNRPITHHQSNK